MYIPIDKYVNKYDEDRILNDLRDYIEHTYDFGHYSLNNFQATEFIMDSGHGEGFYIGNVMKYAQRYGKKNGKDRKDLLKIAHYAIMAIYNHDKEHKNSEETVSKSTYPSTWPYDEDSKKRLKDEFGYEHKPMVDHEDYES